MFPPISSIVSEKLNVVLMSVWRKVIGPVILLPVVVVAGIGLFGETRVEPVAWQPPSPPSRDSGPYQTNTLLESAQVVGTANLKKPESLAVGPDGLVYTGLENGDIVRFKPDVLQATDNPKAVPIELVANTGGRPLGLTFHPQGFLVIADGVKGLVRVDIAGISNPSTSVKVLSGMVDGVPYKFVDDVAVSPDGRYAYYSDASTKFGLKEVSLDILEHGGHGRLIQYDFETGSARVLLAGLQFANGVAVSADGDYVLINETGAYQIRKVWLKGPKAGKDEVFVDNLPGFPDNIRRDAQGNFWVAFPSPRDKLVDSMAEHPGLRKAMGRFLEVIQFPVKPVAMTVAFSPEGKVVANLQAPKANGYYYVTQVTPVGNTLFLSSVQVPGLATYPNPLMK
ncbi:SMP-30/gluconolactonase/LRE family protein [Limnobacter humi]|uniref:SMP-30/gluconolactonase/LRE family protein n=1 Tax=Limnobacter humi TaxID=1778671 RepID=A0ABT1WDP5_9BURK|nr:SMP-30/gluconolactonase/LRE family protein [Limnobacter humi]MCQ8895499.1 SMP-30/gluconolactonase/LRE family protein [Limnobacter humi]